jgi:hypothetical protein
LRRSIVRGATDLSPVDFLEHVRGLGWYQDEVGGSVGGIGRQGKGEAKVGPRGKPLRERVWRGVGFVGHQET